VSHGVKARGPGGAEPYGRDRIRRALLHFLGGRALSSALGVINLIVLIRLLSPADFGLYASLLSIQVVFLAASSFGIESTMERYLPEVRMTAGPAGVLPFLLRCLALRLVALLSCALLLLAGLHLVLPQLGLDGHGTLVSRYAWVIVAVALMNSASAALEALLHQRAAQLCAIVYALTRSAFIAWGVWHGHFDVDTVVTMDLAAALAAFGVAVVALSPYVRHPVDQARHLTDTSVPWARFRAFASRNYAGQMLMQFTSSHGLRLLLTSLAGLLETARLGFAMSLSEVIQRYLPATLLMRMIRPVFVSRYLENRDFAQLNAFANLVLKLNMLMLAPAIGFVLGAGPLLVDLLSGGRYPQTHWLLLGMLGLLLTTSHQVVISILAGTLEENDIQVRAAAYALVALPAAAVLVPAVGAYGAMAGAWVGALTFNTCSAVLLRRRGFAYRIDWSGLGRLLAAAGPGAAMAFLVVATLPAHGPAVLAAAALGCVVVFVVVATRVNAFGDAERRMIHGLLPARFFPF